MLPSTLYPVGKGGPKSRYIPRGSDLAASNTLVFTATDPTASKVVVVDGVTYTFIATVAAAGDVKVSGTADDTWTSLVQAVNNSGGTAGAGADYMPAAGAAHPRVRAAIDTAGSGGTITFHALSAGTPGNALTLTTDEAQGTATEATFFGGANADSPLVFDGAVRYPGVAHEVRSRVTIAQVNAGATLLAAIPGWKYRLVDANIIAVGGAAGTVTTVDILATLSTSRKLVAFAQAALTQSAVLRAGDANSAVLADGVSFVENDANTAITIGKTGAAVDTATHFDVVLKFALVAA